jgi:integrase
MTVSKRPIGRPSRFAKYEQFEASLNANMTKRPAYCDGIGIFKGATGSTAWVKIKMTQGGMYKGRSVPAGGAIEHKLGKRASWDWPQLLAERNRMQGLADRGEPLEAVKVETFAEYSSDWLTRKKPTMKGYDITHGHIRRSLNPAFGKKALNAITITDLNRWIGQQSTDLKPSTVQRQLATFNAIMNDAVRSGVIERNPSERADRIKGIEPRQRFVTDDEWQIILKAVEAIELGQDEKRELTPQQIRGWLRHYVVWAFNSGMRRTEILSLTWDQVRDTSKEHTVVEVGNTKTGKPRFVACTPEMTIIIKALRQLERVEGDNRLFPVSLTTLKRSLTRLWKATGLNDVRLHDLRRTHATILIQSNVDPRTVAGRLGHSGTAMLSKHYAVDLGDMGAAKMFGQAVDDRNAAREALAKQTNSVEVAKEIERRKVDDIGAISSDALACDD